MSTIIQKCAIFTFKKVSYLYVIEQILTKMTDFVDRFWRQILPDKQKFSNRTYPFANPCSTLSYAPTFHFIETIEGSFDLKKKNIIEIFKNKKADIEIFKIYKN